MSVDTFSFYKTDLSLTRYIAFFLIFKGLIVLLPLIAFDKIAEN